MENSLSELKGTVEDIVFQNSETGFTVIELSVQDELVTAVGILPAVSAGELLRITGKWDYHQSFGRQFRIEQCERQLPKSAADMLKYLSSGVIKGIGPKTALKIIEEFGDEAFDVLENDPERLSLIKGISKDKAYEINAEFVKQFAVREIMIFLERFGMTSNECLSVYKAFGSRAVEVVSLNPYILCREPVSLSFDRADTIAGQMPIRPARGNRLKAGITHVLHHNLGNGHTCLPREKLLSPCAELLEADESEISDCIDEMLEDKLLTEETADGRSFIFLPYMHKAETDVAQRILIMLQFPPLKGKTSIEDKIEFIEKKFNISYEEKQKEAIATAVEKGMLILTGGPGTGKTTTLNGIIELYENDGLKVSLTAPTGRAAKRMSEITGRDAKTIHRLLEVEWKEGERLKFQRNTSNPLPCDAIIIDELSMVDINLFSSLLDALKLGTRIIMVGDTDQLPAVGAGNVLHDLIDSELIPVVSLKKIFRQAMESLIVTNAHRIVKGEMPVLDSKDNDFFFLKRDGVHKTAVTVCDLYARRLPSAYGYDPLTNIQILCPSKKGETGTVNLNALIQGMINPPDKSKNEYSFSGKVFREGDRVMQTKNNYDIPWKRGREDGAGIFNGDIGTLTEIRTDSGLMKICFDDREAIYSVDSINQLELAYAITIHKSQGSEYDAVIIPLCNVLPRLSYRNLLYTAVTRAKSKLIMVGKVEDVGAMVENNRIIRRYSFLKTFLTRNKKH